MWERGDDESTGFENETVLVKQFGILKTTVVVPEMEAEGVTIQPQILNSPKSFNGVIFSLCLSLLSVAVNLRVMCVLTEWPRRKLRPISVLVFHLSVVAITFSLVFNIYMVEKINLIGLIGPHTCRFLSFSRNVLVCALSLNVVGIVYERIESFRDSIGEILVARLICLLWTVAAISSLPTIFMVEFEINPVTNVEKCKSVPLIGSYEATLLYEFIRFLVVHLASVGYMCVAMCSIRSKIRPLDVIVPVPSRRQNFGAIKKLRFIYHYSILFIINWLPSGVIAFVYKILTRSGLEFSIFQTVLAIMFTLNYLFFILSPLLFLSLNDDIRRLNFLRASCCVRSGRPTISTEVADDGDSKVTSKGETQCSVQNGETEV